MRKMLIAGITALALPSATLAQTCGPDMFSNPAAASGVFGSGAVTVAAVGDIMAHRAVQRDAAANGYANHYASVASFLRRADLTIGNLETPVAQNTLPGGRETTSPPQSVFDDRVYSGYPTFNAHPNLVSALKGAGFDVLQTANNHALDRGPAGVDRTLAAIHAQGLGATGTRSRAEPSAPWATLTRAGGKRIAVLACTFSVNGLADPNHQALRCFSQQAEVLSTIAALAQSSSVDAVLFTPHWGTEYSHTPTNQQRRLARAALDAGAAAVIGTHPHVLQPIEAYTTSDGRPGFIAYSMGNFISSQWSVARRNSAILFFDLVRSGGQLVARAPRYLPTRVMPYRTGGWRIIPTEAIADGAAGLAHVTRILGPQGRLGLRDLGARVACN